MYGEAGWWTTSGNIGLLPPLARVMGVGRQQQQHIKTIAELNIFHFVAKEQGLTQVGSFQCLNGKVDLSTHEALHTLEEWGSQLQSLRQELSVRAIAKQISAARVPYTIKVLAYKNSEGRIKPGHLLVGSSVKGVSRRKEL